MEALRRHGAVRRCLDLRLPDHVHHAAGLEVRDRVVLVAADRCVEVDVPKRDATGKKRHRDLDRRTCGPRVLRAGTARAIGRARKRCDGKQQDEGVTNFHNWWLRWAAQTSGTNGPKPLWSKYDRFGFTR